MFTPDPTAASPREVADNVVRMVEGKDGLVFADLFAEDGVLEYPFAATGLPERLEGRKVIREFHDRGLSRARDLFEMEGVESTVHETTDPEVVIAEIRHHGRSHVTGRPYRSEALGVIRVRNGEIVSYRDYMNPIAVAELTGRLRDLVTALTAES